MAIYFQDLREPWKWKDGSRKIISNVHTGKISFRGFFSTLRNFCENVFIEPTSRRWISTSRRQFGPPLPRRNVGFIVSLSRRDVVPTSRRWPINSRASRDVEPTCRDVAPVYEHYYSVFFPAETLNLSLPPVHPSRTPPTVATYARHLPCPCAYL